jgi:1-phosphofructokinase
LGNDPDAGDVIGRPGDSASVARAPRRGGDASLMVFGPRPLLTVTIEAAGEREPEIHLHAGGQGAWVARMATVLGAHVQLCAALGGEPGQVLRPLVENQGITLRAIETEGSNGVYIHDRRSGEREPVAETHSPGLSRHELDALYGLAIATGLEAGIALLTGAADTATFDGGFYRRLAHDLRENGAIVMGDLSGEQLRGALEGGIDLLKISGDHLVRDGYASSEEEQPVAAGLEKLREAGAANVLVSRAAEPALAKLGDRPVKLTPPRLSVVDPRGAGDSQSAAMAVALARGQALEDALVLGMAAGALNVTRHGLGSGDRQTIERLIDEIECVELDVW